MLYSDGYWFRSPAFGFDLKGMFKHYLSVAPTSHNKMNEDFLDFTFLKMMGPQFKTYFQLYHVYR